MKVFFDDTLAMFTALAAMVAISALTYGVFVLISPHGTLTGGDVFKVGLCFAAALILAGGAWWGWRQTRANP
jgi:hypothetical protein